MIEEREIERAARRGCRVIFPERNQLQLDIDTPAQLAAFEARIEFLRRGEECSVEIVPSKSRGHFHVTVTFPHREFGDVERIALQAVLGSDPLREYMAYLRVLDGWERPCRLFAKAQGV